MHQEVEGPKAFAAFRSAPNDDEALARDQALDEIETGCRHQHVVERDKPKARRFAHVLDDGLGPKFPSPVVEVDDALFALLEEDVVRVAAIGHRGLP